jgi:RNA polymerase sigma factor (sigma-70 family)
MTAGKDKTVRILMAGCREGNKRDWEELIGRLTPVIFAACRKLHLSREESFDVFGKTSLLLLENMNGLRDEEKIFGYVSTIAYREAMAIKVRSRLVVQEQSLTPAETSATSPVDTAPTDIARAQDYEVMARAMAVLPARCRKLLQVLFFDEEELSYKEISEKLGIPIASIGPTRMRCLNKLRTIMRRQGYKE